MCPQRPTFSSSVRVFAPAKINWALTVAGRRPDGFHDLHTVFQTLAWGDDLICRPMARHACRIVCDDPAVPTGADNLIARAWRRLAEAHPDRVGGLDVRLTKRIPMGGGLGGGSSDAAAALVALDRLYGLRLGPTRLEAHAAALGSDCAFFIRGGAQWGEGRGERLRPLANRLPETWLVVVGPGRPSSTAAAYARLCPAHFEGPEAVRRAARAVAAGDLDGLKNSLRNVFYDLATDDRVMYTSVMEAMRSQGLDKPTLSGSGSAVFALAGDRRHAKRVAARLGAAWPIAVATRLRRCGIRACRATPHHESTEDQP